MITVALAGKGGGVDIEFVSDAIGSAHIEIANNVIENNAAYSTWAGLACCGG